MKNQNDGSLDKKLEKALEVMQGLKEVSGTAKELAGGLPPEKKGVLACLVISSASLAVLGFKAPVPAVIGELVLFLGAAILIGWKRH